MAFSGMTIGQSVGRQRQLNIVKNKVLLNWGLVTERGLYRASHKEHDRRYDRCSRVPATSAGREQCFMRTENTKAQLLEGRISRFPPRHQPRR